MADVFRQLYSINIVSYVGVQDFADRLSFLVTVTLLSVCCVLTTAMSYLVRPIACFLPNTFGEFLDGKELAGQIEYATNFCWTEGTYAVHPLNFSIDATARDGGLSVYADRKIVYYQWVPFLLALQAVMFYLPRLLWHSISYDRAGTDVGHIVKIASDASREEEETHDKLVTYATRMIEVMLDRAGQARRRPAAASRTIGPESVGRMERVRRFMSLVMPTRLSGSWLILTYLFIKLAYFINAIGQLVLMQHFLQLRGSHYSLLGLSLLRDIVSGSDWQNSMVFPRVGCCAVFFRSGVGGNWQFSQCTLPVNIINEKVYIFLWFWFVFVAAATLASIGAWLYRVVNATLTSRFVKKYLRLADNYAELKQRKAVTRGFLRQFLRRDGAFVLKMISLNAGDVVCAEIVQRLWRRYVSVEGFDAASASPPAEKKAAAAAIAAATGASCSGKSGHDHRDNDGKDDDDEETAAAKKPETGVFKLSCDRMPPGRPQRRRSSVVRQQFQQRRPVSFSLGGGRKVRRGGAGQIDEDDGEDEEEEDAGIKGTTVEAGKTVEAEETEVTTL